MELTKIYQKRRRTLEETTKVEVIVEHPIELELMLKALK